MCLVYRHVIHGTLLHNVDIPSHVVKSGFRRIFWGWISIYINLVHTKTFSSPSEAQLKKEGRKAGNTKDC